MRRRFGAIHSDTTEEYIQQAQSAWNKDLFYYEGTSKKSAQNYGNFDFDERETNNTEIEEEVQMEAQNVKIILMDAENDSQTVFDYCGQEYHQQKKDFDYVSKIEVNKNKQITYHFWINNIHSTKFTDIVDVYVKNCDVVIYMYNKSVEEHYQEFVEKISRINNKSFVIYKVNNAMNRTQSFKSLNEKNQENVIAVKSLQEAITKTINQYI